MLNPDKYDKKISKLEKGLESNTKKKEEKLEEIKKLKKSNRKCFFALLFIFALLGFIALAIFYAPLREYCCAVLKIDINNPTTSDIYKGIAIVVVYKIVEVIVIAIATGQKIDLLDFVFGIQVIFSWISGNNSSKKYIKKELKNIKKQAKNIQDSLNLELKQKEEETKKLSETNEMFERGVAENDLQLIQHAADLGNPNAMMAEGKRLYEQVKQSEHTDKTVLEEAAKYGYPDAIFEIAEMWLDEAALGLLTSSEKKELLKKVDSYVKTADFTNHPDGRVLQISRQVYSTEEKDPYKLLEEVRDIKNEKQLSNKYKELADIIIKKLVSEIDHLECIKKINKG